MKRFSGCDNQIRPNSIRNINRSNTTRRVRQTLSRRFAFVTILLAWFALAASPANAQTVISLTVTQSSSQNPGSLGTGSGGPACPKTLVSTSGSVTVTLPSQYSSIAQALAAGYVFTGTGSGEGSTTTYQNGTSCTVNAYTQSVPMGFFLTFSQNLFASGIQGSSSVGAYAPAGSVWSISPAAISYNGPYIQSAGGSSVGTMYFTIQGDIGGCKLGLPASLKVQAVGPTSLTHQNTVIEATFSPPGGTLKQVATACGYDHFDWRQTVEYSPFPMFASLCAALGGSLPCTSSVDFPDSLLYTDPPASAQGITVPSLPFDSKPFPDPPPGDYTYMHLDAQTEAEYKAFIGAYPFVYTAEYVAQYDNATTLPFHDQPKDLLLPFGQYSGFSTRLVGVLPGLLYDDIPGTTFTWRSTYRGTKSGKGIGGIIDIQTVSTTDNGGGIGGVTITSLNGVPTVTMFSTFLSTAETSASGFELVSKFTLGSGSTGINPLTQAVVLSLGSYGVTIPAGSFHLSSTGNYHFEGTVNGVDLEARIAPSTTVPNSYTLTVEGNKPVDLSSPVIELTIGSDMGLGAVKLDD